MKTGYSINVSRNGIHFFRTDPDDCTNERTAMGIFLLLLHVFPEKEGYQVSCADGTGVTLDWNCQKLG